MLVEKLLRFVDKESLENLIVATKADEGIRKLDARSVLALLMYSLLESDKIN